MGISDMSEIKAGDWVVLFRWPHGTCLPEYGKSAVLGERFRVTKIWEGDYTCSRCEQTIPGPRAQQEDHFRAYPLSWLKRIDPLTDPQPEQMKEDA